jgi:signal transduction histidine kinase
VSERLSTDDLRSLFLFEGLTEEQLGWLASEGYVKDVPAGVVFTEGEPGTCCFVLLEGSITLSKRSHGQDVEVTRTGQRGVYAGAFYAFMGDRDTREYTATMRAVEPSRFFVVDAETMATMMHQWFPMAMHLIDGVIIGTRRTSETMAERERLLALGSLSAGLTHELNNPAAAAVRAASALRERVAGMRHKLALLADGSIPAHKLHLMVDLQEAAVERVAKAPARSPLEIGDAEDELSDWFDAHGVRAGWELAPILVGGGLDVEWAQGILDTVGATHLESATRWLAYTVETEALMNEIGDSVTRISTLVGAAKQYSQMDRAPYQVVDLHELLESTLVMLASKIGKVRVVRDFDRELPPVPAYAAELNQVWTNIIDNAVSAMGGEGTLTVRTCRDGDNALVEIGDTGPGIPEQIRQRIFEPFFTTKPIGEGTGLGLDISWRIVVNKHSGELRVVSEPGDTRFQVVLPLHPAADQVAN